MDRTKDACRHQSNNRVIMWYKIRELYSKGFNKTQIAFQLGLHRSTVRRYLKMDEDTLTAKLQHRRRYPRILDKYESYVCDVLSRYRFCPPPRFMTGWRNSILIFLLSAGKPYTILWKLYVVSIIWTRRGFPNVFMRKCRIPLTGNMPRWISEKAVCPHTGTTLSKFIFCHGDEPFQAEVRVFFPVRLSHQP